MNILVIGGTKFLGRAIVDAALAAGHNVTLFNRGQTNPELYPEVEKLRGDRTNTDDLARLKGRLWDVVVDTCGYVPRIVDLSAKLLADSTDHYTFISSISVYSEAVYGIPNTDESGALAQMEDETVEEITGETYGPLKVLCEQAAESAMPGRVLNVRAGLIVGPYDPTDRFTYWPVKMQRQDEMLVPPLESFMQMIDVRDLAEWVIRMGEQRKAGVYNVTGPDHALTFGQMLETEAGVLGEDAAKTHAMTEAFITENDIQPWVDLPVWLPQSAQGMAQINVGKALGDGLKFRDLRQTIEDTLAWYNAHHSADDALKAGLSLERETELLKKWKIQA